MRSTSTLESRATWHTPLLVGHVAVSVALIGASLVLVALGIRGLRGADPRTVYPAAHLIDAWVVAPMALLALATGVALAVLTGRGLLTWVTIKLATTTGTAGIVIFVLEPRLAASARAALAGEPFATSDFLPLAIAPSAAAALLVVNVALGIIQPSGRHLTEESRDGHRNTN